MTYRTYRRFWAVLLFAGGLLGIANVVFGLVALPGTGPVWQVAAGLGVFTLSTIAGVGLWRGLRWGVAAAIGLFAAQVVFVEMPGFGYLFYTGAALPLTMTWEALGAGGLNIGAWIGSEFSLRLLTSAVEGRYVVGINLLSALALGHFLLGARRGGDLTPEERGEIWHRPDTEREPKPRIRPYG